MTVYSSRARYVPVERGFNIKRSPLEPTMFTAEPELAFAADTPTGLLPLDMSAALGTGYPATTPLLLTRYARIRSGESLDYRFGASGELWAVLSGSGRLVRGSDTIRWSAGDLLALPGGVDTTWTAGSDAVLWVTTDEPALSFAGVRPETGEAAPIRATHYTAADIATELATVYERRMEPDTPGRALFLSTEASEALGTCLPSLTLTLNAVRPGESQRPHRHNAAAIVLALREAGCSSTIGGRKMPWRQHATLLTPAGSPHSHGNEREVSGRPVAEDDIALALIVQDGGLHYHARTMGFAFAD